MKVVLVRSAGLIPVVTETVVDTEALEPERASTLEARVREAGLFDTRTAPSGAPDQPEPALTSDSRRPLPDAPGYRLTIIDGQWQRTLDLDEGSLTAPVRGLIDWIGSTPDRVESVRPIGRRDPA